MSPEFRPPQQQRSRDTLARLLAATIEVLEAHGLEGATIPRIARAAGMAPASIYRRFSDRSALYRAAVLEALEASAKASRGTLRLESFPDKTFDGVVTRLVHVTMQQYRWRPGLMRALTRFIEQDTSQEFRSRALGTVAGNFEWISELLLAFRDQIPHPDPRRAITFALLTMATVIEVRALEQVSMWRQLMPLTDDELEAEVTTAFLAYLRSPVV